MNRIVQVVLSVLIVAIVAAGSFIGGTMYGKGQTQTAAAAGAGAPGQGGILPTGEAGAATRQGGMLTGVVQTAADGVMTISDSSGKLIQVKVTDTTLIQKQASVGLTDLQKGDTVFVSASQGSDGTYTARSVQVANVGENAGLATGDQPAGGNLLGSGGNAPGGGFPLGGNFPPGGGNAPGIIKP